MGLYRAFAVLDNVDMHTQEIRPYLISQEPVPVSSGGYRRR
jgi:hypothetical protein